MHSGVSGWYARLDRTLSDRREQVQTWLEAWGESLKVKKPVAALLPSDWPTLPANLLADAGHVLDHLLARFDAEGDGRSPRGAHPTPPRLADAMIASELLEPAISTPVKAPATSMPLDALPPGFRQHLESLNLSSTTDDSSTGVDEEAMVLVEQGKRTVSGIPLPLADTSCGGGLFIARILRFHSEILADQESDVKEEDTRRLLKGLQLVDVNQFIVEAARHRILLETIRHGLVTSEGNEGSLSIEEAKSLLESGVASCDTLQDDWPWNDGPELILTNPPWLRIKDRFRGHEEGSRMRKELGESLRSRIEADGTLRFSTMRGNVNLYRLFIERGLQVLSPGGRLRIIAPDSLLREQSSTPLRELLVNSHSWKEIWALEEANQLFPGITQGVVILSIVSQGETCDLLMRGPLGRSGLKREHGGLANNVPRHMLEKEDWYAWTKGGWAVPRLPRDSYDRRKVLSTIKRLALAPRLGESSHWLVRGGDDVRVRVGEIDQTAHSSKIETWTKGKRSRPFIRGVHFAEDENGIYIHHPAFDSSIPSRAAERQLSMWVGSKDVRHGPRIACQAIVNAHQSRRLRWAVIREGCVLGNSVNHIELSKASEEFLALHKGDLTAGLEWLCDLLNDEDLDLWARSWAANNNVNNYELELLPLLEPEAGVTIPARVN